MSSHNLPKTYKACVIEKSGAPLKIKEVELKLPEAGQVLIKVLACGVCHTDAVVMEGHMDAMVQYPLVPGHEVIGTVVAVGAGEKKWKDGDRVGGGWHGGHDATCKTCSRGLFQMCDNEAINGVTRDGGYAEYCLLRSEAVVHIPEDLDPAEVAPLLCAGVTVFNGIRKMEITPGEVVAIQGLGGLGHLAIQYARKMGYRTVALSSSGAKRDFAMQLGATDYVDGSKEDATEVLQKMGGAALVVVTAPNPKVMGALVNACGPRGKVLVLAPVGEITVNTITMINKGVSIGGWPSGQQVETEEAIEFAQRQGVNCQIERFSMDKVNEAMQHMLDGKVRFRGVLVMD